GRRGVCGRRKERRNSEPSRATADPRSILLASRRQGGRGPSRRFGCGHPDGHRLWRRGRSRSTTSARSPLRAQGPAGQQTAPSARFVAGPPWRPGGRRRLADRGVCRQVLAWSPDSCRPGSTRVARSGGRTRCLGTADRGCTAPRSSPGSGDHRPVRRCSCRDEREPERREPGLYRCRSDRRNRTGGRRDPGRRSLHGRRRLHGRLHQRNGTQHRARRRDLRRCAPRGMDEVPIQSCPVAPFGWGTI
ncbi:MAG: Threonylcarbamoyl-AMP synthase, partial [uncultured Thermomicrobiales bacterium]